MILVAAIIPGLVLGLLMSMFPLGESSFVSVFIVIPLMTIIALIVSSTVYASYYASYRDVFGIPEVD